MVDLPKCIVRRNEHNHYCIFSKQKYLVQPRMLGQEETLESTREMDSVDEQVLGALQ